jgi:hypothetical protein
VGWGGVCGADGWIGGGAGTLCHGPWLLGLAVCLMLVCVAWLQGPAVQSHVSLPP